MSDPQPTTVQTDPPKNNTPATLARSDAPILGSVSDEDVASSRRRVAELEEEVATARIRLASAEASRNNGVRKDQLDLQAEELRRELENLNQQIKFSENPSRVSE